MVFYVLLPIIVIAMLGRIMPWEYIGFILLLAPMVLVLLLLQMFFFGQEPFIYYTILNSFIDGQPFIIRISEPGISFGLSLGLRIMAMGLTFTVFVISTDPFDIGQALNSIGISFRGSFMVGFALRLVPLIQEELNNITNAAIARGSHSPNTIHPIRLVRGIATISVPLAIGSLKRATQMALAMEIRGFSFPSQMNVKHTYMKEVRMRKRDWFSLIVFFSLWGYWMSLRLPTLIQEISFEVLLVLAITVIFIIVLVYVLGVVIKRQQKKELAKKQIGKTQSEKLIT
jgi:energy-coupling factor transport system permease protein